MPLPLFQLDVSLADDCQSLLLSPAEDEFVEGVGVIMEGFVEACSVVERMLENEDLVCTVIEEEGLEVQMTMRDLVLDEDFEEHRGSAAGLLAGAYQAVVTFTSKYNPFRCASGRWAWQQAQGWRPWCCVDVPRTGWVDVVLCISASAMLVGNLGWWHQLVLGGSLYELVWVLDKVREDQSPWLPLQFALPGFRVCIHQELCRAMLIEDMALDIKDLEAQYRSAVLAEQRPQTDEVEEAAATAAPGDEVEGEEGEEAPKVTIETFEAAMERLQDQQAQMQALGDFEDVSVMRLSVSEMKNSMLPVPQACLADLKV